MSISYQSHIKPSANLRFSVLLVTFFVGLLTIVSPTTPAQAVSNPLFTTREVGYEDISAFKKWTDVRPRYEREHAKSIRNNACIGEDCLNQKWEALLITLADKPVMEQIAEINDFFNAMPYVSDMDNYGVVDLWQTPYELMERGGDCEDYAIAKYISLKRLGVPEDRLRLLVVRDQKLGGIIHAVLEVKVGSEMRILDNQASDVRLASEVFHYQPLFAINEAQWWAYK